MFVGLLGDHAQIGGGISPPDNEFWVLVAGAALYAISWFLLIQGQEFQRWATEQPNDSQQTQDEGQIAQTPETLNAETGSGMALGVGILALMIAFIHAAFYGPFVGEQDLIPILIRRVLVEPRIYFSIAVAASLAPAFMGLFKFTIAFFLLGARQDEESGTGRRSPMAAASGAVLNLLVIAGSVASLITVFS